MSYVKLSEVTLVELATDANLLIEEDGDIKRISTSNIVMPQVQADWNETDATKKSYILNKPESLSGSGKVVTYTFDSGLLLDGIVVTAQQVLDEWNNGSTLRFAISDTNTSNVFNVSYTMASGSLSNLTINYFDNTGTLVSRTI